MKMTMRWLAAAALVLVPLVEANAEEHDTSVRARRDDVLDVDGTDRSASSPRNNYNNILPQESLDQQDTFPALILEDDDIDIDFDQTTTAVASSPRLLLRSLQQDDADKNSTNEKDVCSTQTNCSACTSHSYGCHWCAKDHACHARGSVYGCVWGMSCSKEDDHGDDNNDDNNNNNTDGKNNTNGCAAHTNCTMCTLSSHLCHWCAHDNACHAIGSVYGCLTGVDCFSNDRCRRTEPEPLDTSDVPDAIQMKTLPLVLILITAGLLACCATCCFCCANGLKGAYDDLIVVDEEGEEDHMMTVNENNYPYVDEAENDNADEDEPGEPTPLLSNNAEPAVSLEVDQANAGGDDQEEQDAAAEHQQDPPATGDDENDETAEQHQGYVQLIDIEQQPRSVRTGITTSLSSRRRPRRHMQRLYNACSICYCITIAMIAGLTFGSIRYFPKMPLYNICNDDVAWKSLIETMASMKVEADFEILASVANYNNINVCVEKGAGGAFRHGNVSVGTFDIPPVCVMANAVTDILIVAHFAPDRWKSFDIGKEYYRGNLVLEVKAAGAIRVPSFFNATFKGDFDNIVVHVNQMANRHYCHCPSWKEAKNETPSGFWEDVVVGAESLLP